jgi:xanthine dehydrogenase accessory factor
MKKKLEIWQFAAERLKRNEQLMLLVVAQSAGSSPGRQGFKMIVAADGLAGSIGGGVMEVALVEQARLRITNYELRITEIVEQVHRRNAPDASGMICSGKQTIIFFKLTNEHFNLVRKIPAYIKNRRRRYLRITQNELCLPQRNKNHFHFKFEQSGENEFVYEESLGYKNKLFIIGGGHCALALSELMSKMDFHISLFDDRRQLNTLDKNHFADEKIIIDSYENIGEFIPERANAYVVVMTLGYKFDEIVIRKLFDRNFKYFGVLGSKAKMKTLLKNLETEGFDKERLTKIRTPVGIDINSRTPEEIAVSIAAEIIKVKNA